MYRLKWGWSEVGEEKGEEGGRGSQEGKERRRGSLLTPHAFLSVQGDFGNHLIRRIDIASGTVTTLAGAALSTGSTNGMGTAARFFYPLGVAIDAAGAIAIVVSTKR